MLDRNMSVPLYIQFKKEITDKILRGEYRSGNPLPTEKDLCNEYGISRFPVRQAMDELVAEGYLVRTRGRGTFVSQKLTGAQQAVHSKIIGLVAGKLTGGFYGQVLNGFEKQTRERGYLATICNSEAKVQGELDCIDRLVDFGVSGILIFPCDGSRIGERIDTLAAKRIYLGILDRNPGLINIDYVGSDNIGGAYTAVQHLSFQGYKNVVFISDMSNVSSVNERLEGYLKAVGDLGLNSLTRININEDLGRYPHYAHRLFLGQLKEELVELKKHLPLGIFASNDPVAIQCMKILAAEGIGIGREVGIVGFDNTVECDYTPVPLTSVAQSGILIGQSAADIAIDKIEGKSSMVFRSIVPTQLVIRNSCGEKS